MCRGGSQSSETAIGLNPPNVFLVSSCSVFPVFNVIAGSNNNTSTSSATLGRCSAPRGIHYLISTAGMA